MKWITSSKHRSYRARLKRERFWLATRPAELAEVIHLSLERLPTFDDEVWPEVA